MRRPDLWERGAVALDETFSHDVRMQTAFDTKNDWRADVREKVVTILNQTLADLSDLYSQTKQAHWNVRGRQFYSLHKLFDELAETVEGHIDPLAERIPALG